MVGPPRDVRDHYEAEVVEAERLTRGAGQLELLRTQEIIRRHRPPGPLTIHDVGGGAGAHAEGLAARSRPRAPGVIVSAPLGDRHPQVRAAPRAPPRARR